MLKINSCSVQPRLSTDYENVDYDSSCSDDEEVIDEYEEEEDIFKEPKVRLDTSVIESKTCLF